MDFSSHEVPNRCVSCALEHRLCIQKGLQRAVLCHNNYIYAVDRILLHGNLIFQYTNRIGLTAEKNCQIYVLYCHEVYINVCVTDLFNKNRLAVNVLAIRSHLY